MNQANTKVSASKISSTSTKPAENGTKSRSSVSSSRIRAHSGLKLNLNLKKAPNVKVIFSESESSKETSGYMRDKSCERHSRKGKDDIAECVKVISETFKIVENSERKRSPSREKAPKVPMNGISVEEKSYARCTRSRAQKILHPSKETNTTLKPEAKRRSPSREKPQKSPAPSDNISREKKAYNKSIAKQKVQITTETKHDAVKNTKNPLQPSGKFSPTKIQRLSERLTAHTESSKRKLRNPNVQDITISDLQDAEKTAVKRNGEEPQHNVRVFEKSEATHSAREKREVSVRNTKKSQSSFAKKEVVEVTFSKAEVSESFTSSSSTIKRNASGAEVSHLLNGSKMEFDLLEAESMPVIMNGTNIDIDNLEGTDVDFDPANKGKNESGMNASSKIPRKAQVIQSGMKCNASMKKETTVGFDSGCEDIQL